MFQYLLNAIIKPMMSEMRTNVDVKEILRDTFLLFFGWSCCADVVIFMNDSSTLPQLEKYS